mmetsp:Transcript_2591/g.6191  ORF Transcript_2591/g.6191 Transcript_2591/m.6191 type:complete len:213 (+) Transcript_2591:76-714(+)
MQAASLGDVANSLQAQAQQAQREDAAQDAHAGGVMIAPGVRFSDKLWERLGGKTREIEKQKRRERLTDITAFPEVPTSIFDTDFRRDAMWKKRELKLRQAYVEHLEQLTVRKDDEKLALQEKAVAQITGVYKLAEEDAIERLATHVDALKARSFRPATREAVCVPEKEAAIQCYGANSGDPLACAGLVAALQRCAVLACRRAVEEKAGQARA